MVLDLSAFAWYIEAMQDTQASADVQFLRLGRVLAAVGLGRSALYQRMADGRFPQPLKLGRAALWPSDVIAAWQDDVRRHGERAGTYPRSRDSQSAA